MNDRNGVRNQFPMLRSYGDKHVFLSSEEAVPATAEERIKSVWPFIVRRVLAFNKTLKPRERANYDPEDVLAELWVKLAEKNDSWESSRGSYITFVSVIVERELYAIRDKSRTIEAPRNSSCRIRQYEKEETDGTISQAKLKTASDIRRSLNGPCDSGACCHPDGDRSGMPFDLADANAICPAMGAEMQETFEKASAVVMDAVMTALTPLEANVVSRVYGLGGRSPAPEWFVAFECQIEESEVRRAKERATKKIRKHLAFKGLTAEAVFGE